ncbi:MAG: hypothetical protein GY720_16525 [bacterium]|nr:hypothetical protein [bacterium]
MFDRLLEKGRTSELSPQPTPGLETGKGILWAIPKVGTSEPLEPIPVDLATLH